MAVARVERVLQCFQQTSVYVARVWGGKTNNRKTKSIERNKSHHEGNKKDANKKLRQTRTCKEKTAKKIANDIVMVTKSLQVAIMLNEGNRI